MKSLKKKKQGLRDDSSSRKHAAPLSVEIPFDEFVARIVRVKPEKKTKK